MYLENNNERGYALVMTLAILSGMLVLIVPLVSLNKMRNVEAKSFEVNTYAHFGIESAKSLTEFVSYNNGNASQCAFARSSSLPGWRDIPLRLYTSDGTTINNILPAFLMMSQPMGDLFGPLSEHDIYNEPRHRTPNVDGAWIMVDGELMRAGTGGRGLAGTRSAHLSGAQTYALGSAARQAWAKVNGEWYEVGVWTLNDDLTGSFAGLPSSLPPNTTIELYPTRVEEDPKGKEMDINIRIVDERSKININSMSHTLAEKLNLSIDSNRNVPYLTLGDLKQDGVDSESIARFTNLITSNSTPDYSLIRHQDLYGHDRIRYSKIPYLTREINDWPRLYQHPINVNTANVNVLGKVFLAMDLKPDAEENLEIAYNIARGISKYRRGNGDNFDGDENPFDGKDGEIYYTSPAEEFRAFINSVDSFRPHLRVIMQHIYAEGNLMEYAALDKKSVPICFQRDLVQTATISSRIKNGIKPVAEKKFTMTYKDNYSNKTVFNEIVLDSYNGWNSNMSTFHGIEWRQPIVSGNGVGYDNGAVKRGEFNFYHAGDNWSESASLSRGIVGFYGNKKLYTKVLSYDDQKLKVNFSDVSGVLTESFNSAKRIDFGLRVMANLKNLTDKKAYKIQSVSGDEFTLDTVGSGLNAEGGLVAYDPGPNSSGNVIIAEYTSFIDNKLICDHAEFPTEMEGIPEGAVMIPMLNRDEIYASPDHPNLYISGVDGVDPYYETVLIREGVKWEKVEWWGAPIDNNSPQVKEVEWVSYDVPSKAKITGPEESHVYSDGVPGLENGGMQRYELDIGESGPFLRLKFKFNQANDTEGITADGCPQIFRIRVTYSKQKMNNRVVLSSH